MFEQALDGVVGSLPDCILEMDIMSNRGTCLIITIVKLKAYKSYPSSNVKCSVRTSKIA